MGMVSVFLEFDCGSSMMQEWSKNFDSFSTWGCKNRLFFVEKMVSSVVARPSAISYQAAWVEVSAVTVFRS